MAPRNEASSVANGARRPLSRSSTTSSKASNRKPFQSRQYWDNIICLFSGLGTSNLPGGTSTNNRDYFPNSPAESRPQSRASHSPQPLSPSGVVSLGRTSSLTRRSTIGKRVTASNSFHRHSRHQKYSSIGSLDGVALQPVPEVQTESIGCDLPHGSHFRASTPYQPTGLASVVGQTKVIGVWRDGKTVWIPEYIFEQFSEPSDVTIEQQSQPTTSDHVFPRRPDMRISIPAHPAGGSISSHSESSAPNSETWSPHHSIGTSRTSSDILTPFEDRSPSHNQVFQVTTGDKCEDESLDLIHVSGDPASFTLPTPPLQPRNPRRISGSTEHHCLPPRPYGDMPSPNASIPPVPRKSRKRDFIRNLSRRRRSRRKSNHLTGEDSPVLESAPPVPEIPPMRRQSTANSLSNWVSESLQMKPKGEKPVSQDTAESLIFQILEKIDDLKDLRSISQINRGFYSVFKRHEMNLLKTVLYNYSAPGWELREVGPRQIISKLGCPDDEYTPMTYLQFVSRDQFVLSAIRTTILHRCQSFLRDETIEALRGRAPSKSKQIDNALWRIWTFSIIFGPGNKREMDLEGQMDWLQGGQKARGQKPFTKNAHNARSVLQNVRPSFALGNVGGLNADELHDMMEMWNCLRSLLSGIVCSERVKQAKAHGVFNGQNVRPGDKAHEEFVLEEWVNYVLTLGLSAILDLSDSTTHPSPRVFNIASNMGWTTWKRPFGEASRARFLKEAVSRIYDDSIAQSSQQSKFARECGKTQESKRRSRMLAEELRQAKRNTDFASVPFSEERPMSVCTDRIQSLDLADASASGGSTPHYELNSNQELTSFELDEYPAIRHGRLRNHGETSDQADPTLHHHHHPDLSTSPRSSSSPPQTSSVPVLIQDSSSPGHASAQSSTTNSPCVSPGAGSANPQPALPMKSSERVAFVQLVAKGWSPKDARQALKATAVEGGHRDGADHAVEKASKWLTEREELSNLSFPSPFPV